MYCRGMMTKKIQNKITLTQPDNNIIHIQTLSATFISSLSNIIQMQKYIRWHSTVPFFPIITFSKRNGRKWLWNLLTIYLIGPCQTNPYTSPVRVTGLEHVSKTNSSRNLCVWSRGGTRGGLHKTAWPGPGKSLLVSLWCGSGPACHFDPSFPIKAQNLEVLK